MKTLVTGGAGFIGSHLVDKLISLGCEVIVLDNLKTGRRENLSSVINSRKLKLINLDIADEYGKIEKYFKNVTWVFHLAALADIIPSVIQPLIYHRTNVDGTVNVLVASRKNKVKRFIYIASSSCYGIPKVFPTSETGKIDPQYPYALTKYIGEQYAFHWYKVYRLPVVSLRLFNVYGPRARTSGTYGAVFGTFLAQKLAGKPFTVVGNGKQTRDFIYVSDVIEAIIKAAKSDIEGEDFNVGSGYAYSINRLVDLLGGEVVYIPKRPGEPEQTLADISKIKNNLGWSPKINFDDGVKIMMQNINYWKDAPVWTVETISKETKEWFKYLGRK